ncbi:hypothetical protein AN958_02893 [Leucoagaricus sp. SymC.cos]|nr:hypothetical protein AN958_02893 [Leucoagaricus sp. SymC.cos]
MDKFTQTSLQIFVKEIAVAWKQEVIQDPRSDFTPEMTDYCIEGLKCKAPETFKQTGRVYVFNGDIVKSDCAIPNYLRSALKAAVAPRENIPPRKKDWHPGSNNQALDPVHPSLFPLREEVDPEPPKRLGFVTYYKEDAKWDSLVMLTSLAFAQVSFLSARLTMITTVDVGSSATYIKQELPPKTQREGPKPSENESPSLFHSRKDEWQESHKSQFLVRPNSQPFLRDNTHRSKDDDQERMVDLKRDFGDTGLQIIVKLANIHLTPDKPGYNRGTWHIEGQLNERICASASYYYDMENITPSYLAFRQHSDVQHLDDMRLHYRQYNWNWLKTIYGTTNYRPAIQYVGGVQAREGRVVTFPNLFQYRVRSFKFADPTKPDHRKILALFLVDPRMKIISTANIPCQ